MSSVLSRGALLGKQIKSINCIKYKNYIKNTNYFKNVRHFSKTRVYKNIENSGNLLETLLKHEPNKTAIIHGKSGKQFVYEELVKDVLKWRNFLYKQAKGEEIRVSIMGENSYEFVVTFLACLTTPGVTVIPLCTLHTDAELKYQINNSESKFLITTNRFKNKMENVSEGRNVYLFEKINEGLDNAGNVNNLTDVNENYEPGMIIYTSGTSGKPKGVLTPISTFTAQSNAILKAWEYSSSDYILHTLPLHHTHGLLNALFTPIRAGSTIEFEFPFSSKNVLLRLLSLSKPKVTIYTAVPTIYSRIIDEFNETFNSKSDSESAEKASTALSRLRLAMCGSAALPRPLRENWDKITLGKVPLLERYGMTEVGMALSQPINIKERINGSVGHPLPGVRARIVSDIKSANNKILYDTYNGFVDGKSSHKFANFDKYPQGDLLLSGKTVFSKYWKRPEATEESFIIDDKGTKWFITGDSAAVDAMGNFYMKGRLSMDILKSGGEKLSALEIEREILSIPGIKEACVIGLPSKEWGQEVTTIVVMHDGIKKITPDKLKSELKKTLAGWKIPKKLLVVDSIPKNQMGKMNKKKIARDLFPEYFPKE